MLENTELAILREVSTIPANNRLEIEMKGQDRVRDNFKGDASNRSRMDIITKSFTIILLVIIATTMIYQLVRSTNSDNNTEKMSDQPNKSGTPSTLFIDLSRKNQELARKIDKLDATVARNNERSVERLDNLDKMTVQTNQKFDGNLQKLDAIVMHILNRMYNHNYQK